ncbi:MAG: DUF1674 domain-containing protein [Gammaproteobacteria bacterium]
MALEEKNNPPTEETKNDHQEEVNSGHDCVKEIGGPKGPEPTRYGDWERKGRCIDF